MRPEWATRGAGGRRSVWLILLLLLAVALSGCVRLPWSHAPAPEEELATSGLATPDHPVTSPSGKFRLEVAEETLEKTRHWRFTITGGEKPFTPDEAYRTQDALFILWDERDRVWVYSGDVGTFFWEQAGDGAWHKHAYADRPDTPVPALLQQLRPRQFH